MSEPDLPINVRLRYPDGTEVPVSLVYEGRDTEGIDCWSAVPETPVIERGVRLLADALPGHTSIALRARMERR